MKETTYIVMAGAKDLTQLSKTLKEPEIRVWCHPKSGESDFWKVFNGFKQAQDFIRKNKNNEEFRPEDEPLMAILGYELNPYSLWKLNCSKAKCTKIRR